MPGSRNKTSNLTKKRGKIDESTATAARSNTASLTDNHERHPPAKKPRVSQRNTSTVSIRQITPRGKRQSSHAVNDNRQNPSTATTKTPTQQRRIRRKVVVSPIGSSNVSIQKESTIIAEPVLSSSSSSRVPGARLRNSKFRRVTEQFDVDECRSALLVSSSSSPSRNQQRDANIKKEKKHLESSRISKRGRKVVVKPQKAAVLQQQQPQQQQVVATVGAPERKQQQIKLSFSRTLVVPESKPRTVSNAAASGSAITAITTNTEPKDTKVEKSSVMTIPKTTTNSSSHHHSPDVTKPVYKHNQQHLLENEDSTCSRGGGGIRNGIVYLIWIIWYVVVISVLGTLGTHIVMMNRYGSKWMLTIPKSQEDITQTNEQLLIYSETIESMENKIQELEIDWVNEELTYLSDLHDAQETMKLLEKRIHSLQNEVNEQQNSHSKTVLTMEQNLEQLKSNLANQESIYSRKLEEADETIVSLKQRLLTEGNEQKTLIASLRNNLHQQQGEHTETLTLVQTLFHKLEVVQEQLQDRKVTYENELNFANKSLEDLKQQMAKKEEVRESNKIVRESNTIVDLKDQLNYEKQNKMEALEVIETLREKLNQQENIHTKSLEEIQILQGQVQSEKRLTNEKSNQLQLVTRDVADLQSELSTQKQIVIDATSSMQNIQHRLKEMEQSFRRQKLSSVSKKHQIARLRKELYRQQEIAIETVNFVTTMAIQEQQDAAADVVNFITRTVSSQHAHELERHQEIAIETINFVATTALHEQQQDQENIPDDMITVPQKTLESRVTTNSNQFFHQDELVQNREIGDTIPT